MDRHTRQRRLVEVGQGGQERIGALAAHVAGEGLGAIVQARYLAGAGVRSIQTNSAAIGQHARRVDPDTCVVAAAPMESLPEAPSFDVRDPSARAIAQGAWRALRVLRGALGVGGEGA
jgi:hypothetical protein